MRGAMLHCLQVHLSCAEPPPCSLLPCMWCRIATSQHKWGRACGLCRCGARRPTPLQSTSGSSQVCRVGHCARPWFCMHCSWHCLLSTCNRGSWHGAWLAWLVAAVLTLTSCTALDLQPACRPGLWHRGPPHHAALPALAAGPAAAGRTAGHSSHGLRHRLRSAGGGGAADGSCTSGGCRQSGPPGLPGLTGCCQRGSVLQEAALPVAAWRGYPR